MSQLLAMRVSSSRIVPFSTASVRPRAIPTKQVHLRSLNRSWRAYAEPESQTESKPKAAVEDDEDLPPWVRRERERELQKDMPSAGPWPLYLLLSLFTAIASVGSFFEYANKNPVFGVIQPDSPLWAPILGLFAITGIPMAGFLFFKGVEGANKAAELQDKLDGYMD